MGKCCCPVSRIDDWNLEIRCCNMFGAWSDVKLVWSATVRDRRTYVICLLHTTHYTHITNNIFKTHVHSQTVHLLKINRCITVLTVECLYLISTQQKDRNRLMILKFELDVTLFFKNKFTNIIVITLYIHA